MPDPMIGEWKWSSANSRFEYTRNGVTSAEDADAVTHRARVSQLASRRALAGGDPPAVVAQEAVDAASLAASRAAL